MQMQEGINKNMESIKTMLKLVVISTIVSVALSEQERNFRVELTCQQVRPLVASFEMAENHGSRGDTGIQGPKGEPGNGTSCSCPDVASFEQKLNEMQGNLIKEVASQKSRLRSTKKEVFSLKQILDETRGNLTMEIVSQKSRIQSLETELTSLKTQMQSLEKLDETHRLIFTRDCEDAEWLDGGSGVVTILSPGINRKMVDVMCSDGWTVIQRRINGSVDFYRNWQQYEDGFGDVHGEHWIGLSTIHSLTASGNYKLRVELEDRENDQAYAEYSSITVGDADSNYKLVVGDYTGTAGDALLGHNRTEFSTYDRDNDRWNGVSCSERHHGAWWYNNCGSANLNGNYSVVSDWDGVIWTYWKAALDGLKSTKMMIKRI